MRKVTKENNLAVMRPDLAKEWNQAENGDLTPYDVTCGSGRKVSWIQPYDDPRTGKHFDFVWDAMVRDRVKGIGCPVLDGKMAWPGFNDLATTHPKLAAEWHPTENGDLKPTDVTAGSQKKVTWIQPYDDPNTGKHFDFVWDAMIASRSKGAGCPVLTGKMVWPGFNDLATTHPELAAEWHPTENGDLRPTDVMAGSNKKVRWLQPYDDPNTGKHFDFVWDATINDRSRGCGCPVLAGTMVWPGFNDLATTHPNLAAEWNTIENGDLTPYDVTCGSGKKVSWVQPYDDPITGKHFDFVWDATIASRAKGCGCPVLNGLMVWPGFNDLATTHPELAAEWHPTENGDLRPTDVMAGSNKKVRWIQPYDDPNTGKHFDFVWDATINDRTHGSGCPVLTGHMIWVGFNDLATTHPELAAEWHPTKNGNLKPTDFLAGSVQKVWWRKKVDGEWKEWRSAINVRALYGCSYPGLISSHLEKMTSKIMDRKELLFEIECSFDDLISPKGFPYRYDFFLKHLRVLIECDGKQHFQHLRYYCKNDEEFTYRIESDNIKNAYALKNGIPLLRIPHTYSLPKKQKELEEIVLEFIETKKVPQKILDFYAKFEFSNYVECVNKFQNQLEKTAA